jgi:hypothetical protein
MKELFDEHEKNADEISEIAEERGIELKTDRINIRYNLLVINC